MSEFEIRDIAIGRTLGTVEANTERGARIKAQRQFNTDYSYLSATPVETPDVETMFECDDCPAEFETHAMATWHAGQTAHAVQEVTIRTGSHVRYVTETPDVEARKQALRDLERENREEWRARNRGQATETPKDDGIERAEYWIGHYMGETPELDSHAGCLHPDTELISTFLPHDGRVNESAFLPKGN